jgi:DNA-binding MarR family transcriptional regulator
MSNSAQPLLLELVQALGWVHGNLNHELVKAGYPPIKLNQGVLICNILLGINRPSALAKKLGVSRQAVSIMIKELESQEIVETRDDPNHKLAKIVQINVKNKKFDAAIVKAFNKTETLLGKRIGKAKVNNLKAALNADWGVSK